MHRKTIPDFTMWLDFGATELEIGCDYSYSPGRRWSDTGYEPDDIDVYRTYWRPIGDDEWRKADPAMHDAILDAAYDLDERIIEHEQGRAADAAYDRADAAYDRLKEERHASLRTIAPLLDHLEAYQK